MKKTTVELLKQDMETAIIVESPFQAICAIECIDKYNLKKIKFFVFGQEKSVLMTTQYLKSHGHEAEDLVIAGNTLSILRTQRKHKKYQQIIVGDYFSYRQLLLSASWSMRKTEIVYVDDGNSTISMIPPVNRRRRTGWGVSLKSLCEMGISLSLRIKGVRMSFFTIFDIRGLVPYRVIQNKFELTCNRKDNDKQEDVYIIGTNSNALGWNESDYIQKLIEVKALVTQRFPNQKIYYCPHRRDITDNKKICEQLGVILFDTQVSVEVDFINKKINPACIIGFGSTALLTLKMIFNKSCVISVENQCNEEYIAIDNFYRNNGILIYDLSKY